MLMRKFSVGNMPELTLRQWLLLLPTAGFFAASMTMKGGANLFLYLMFLAALCQLGKPTRWHWRIFAVLSAPLLLAGLQIMFGMPVSLHVLDAPSRFFLAALALFGLTSLPRQWLLTTCYATIIGAFGVMTWGYLSTHYAHYAWGVDPSRGWNGFSNPIPFGSFSALLGFLVFLLPVPITLRRFAVGFSVIKTVGLAAGLMGAYYSGSRAALLVMMAGIFIAIAYYSRWPLRKVAVMSLLCISISSVLLLSGQNKISNRVHEGINDIAVSGQNQNTSMGLRLLMWQTAANIILEHPMLGVGKEGYYEEVHRRIKQGRASSLISTAPHPHNEILNMGVEMGLPGIVLALALYCVPGAFFAGALTASMPARRFAAHAGLLTVVVFFLIGLMDTYFWIVSQTALYGVLICVFAAILLSSDRAEEMA
ncbi:O-antigen ligase [Aquitalea sp. LB_tupeE]|uniref:O-antigen ligase family protein n=1 Tax=Aquitalea sp. LB_tupeE TaxID=2748078 RepID=UPI0015BD35B3|nr:O-antigen ligase family protein [Aquitalea sp. LB_tupeE]NWK78133.1 O-antigen ligase family protein [Aquitalea sp. LB_tupeE]